jgi:hypothetical protein
MAIFTGTDFNKNMNKVHLSERYCFLIFFLENYVEFGGKCGSKPSLRHYPGIYLEGLNKTTEDLSHDILYPYRDTKRKPHE